MKINFKALLLCSFFLFAFIPLKHSIVGKWQTYESDGSKSYIDFTSAGKFTYTNKGKLLHYGIYKMSNDTFLISDHECGNGYWASYKLSFVGDDSVLFAVIEDTCSGRMQQVDKGGLRRAKK
jgi:hypothetical protein